uniref:Basal body-orientation factor 1 n=1 Tax=Arion vulgaris TaxID=1028688 RepID=A0A0B7AKK6_9EUPU
MPKKGKKGKSGKKGKKGGKRGKGKKESTLALAAVSTKIWETRVDIAEKAKQEFRENAKRLMFENDILQTQMFQNERDTIDIITYLKKQDEDKETQLERQLQQMRNLQKDHHKEKESIAEDFSKQINDLEGKLAEKMRELELMHSELKLVKEFRRKRGHMQRQLEDIKEAFQRANTDHKLAVERMEQKFFEEKMRLQQEASQKIAEIAGKAHTEAIAKLDETTKSVYKENVRLTESLSYHIKDGESLKKERDRLLEEATILRQEKEVTDVMVHNKVAQDKQQRETIKEMSEKINVLEKALSHVVREFETESKTIIQNGQTENEAAKIEIIKLQRVIELKTREMNKVKRLAKNILDERTELERFFLLSLDHVKAEVAANQAQYRKDAHSAYQQKMLTAHACKGDYPKIRTFNQLEHSTNSVFRDMEAAETLYNVNGKVDISDLTWEQKEKVLRYLFARMNINRSKPKHEPLLPNINKKNDRALENTQEEEWADTEARDQTFLTQAQTNIVLKGQSQSEHVQTV